VKKEDERSRVYLIPLFSYNACSYFYVIRAFPLLCLLVRSPQRSDPAFRRDVIRRTDHDDQREQRDEGSEIFQARQTGMLGID